MDQKKTTKKDPSAYQLIRSSRCYNCDEKQEPGSIVQLKQADDEREVLCARCADFEKLEFLPGKNAKLTQLAKKLSKRRYVVLRWSELWKCYERQGLLLEPEAISAAKKELV